MNKTTRHKRGREEENYMNKRKDNGKKEESLRTLLERHVRNSGQISFHNGLLGPHQEVELFLILHVLRSVATTVYRKDFAVITRQKQRRSD